jgi:hypothetical protein
MKALLTAWAWHQLARVGLRLVRSRIKAEGCEVLMHDPSPIYCVVSRTVPLPRPHVYRGTQGHGELTRQYREALTAYADTAEALTMARRGK